MGSERVTQLLRLHQKFMQNPGLTVPANQLCNRANVLRTERTSARVRAGSDLVKSCLMFHAGVRGSDSAVVDRSLPISRNGLHPRLGTLLPRNNPPKAALRGCKGGGSAPSSAEYRGLLQGTFNLPTNAKITVNREAAGNDTVKLNSNICMRSTETNGRERAS